MYGQKLQELFNILIHQIRLAQKLTFIKNAEIQVNLREVFLKQDKTSFNHISTSNFVLFMNQVDGKIIQFLFMH